MRSEEEAARWWIVRVGVVVMLGDGWWDVSEVVI